MEFVAYSNVNVDKVKENSPRAAEKSGLYIGSLKGAVETNQKTSISSLKSKTQQSGVPGTGLFRNKTIEGNPAQ